MLRDSKELKQKQEQEQEDASLLTGEYIKTLIANYYHTKNIESSKWYQIGHTTSEWMRGLEHFYVNVLRRKQGVLTYNEYFDLAKMAFLGHQKLGQKSSVAKSYLLQYYNLNVVAALLASGEPVGLLRPYFETMCASPNDASNISYAILLLNTIKDDAAKLGVLNKIYACELQAQILIHPEIASHFVEVFQQLQINGAPVFSSSHKKTDDHVDDTIKKDRLFYILTRLKTANEFSIESMETLKTATTKQLMNIANKIEMSDESPLKITKNITSPKLSPRLFEWVTFHEKKEHQPEKKMLASSRSILA